MNRHLERGALLVELQRYKEAVGELMRAAASPESEVEGLALAAISVLISGDRKEAARLLEKAGRLAPDAEAVLLTRASISLEEGDTGTARTCMQRMLAKHPTNVDLLSMSSCLELACFNAKAAFEQAERGLALDPAHKDCLVYAMASLDLDDPRLPDFIRRLLACAPGNPYGHLALATMAHADNRMHEADHHLAEALRRDPNSLSAKTLKARLCASRHWLYRLLAEGRIGRMRIPVGWRIAALFPPVILCMIASVVIYDDGSAHPPTPLPFSWVLLALMPHTLAVLWIMLVLFWHPCQILARTFNRKRLHLVIRYAMHDLVLPCLLALVGAVALLCHVLTCDFAFYGIACLSPLAYGTLLMAQKRDAMPTRPLTVLIATIMAVAMFVTVLECFVDIPVSKVLWSLILANFALWFLLGPRTAAA